MFLPTVTGQVPTRPSLNRPAVQCPQPAFYFVAKLCPQASLSSEEYIQSENRENRETKKSNQARQNNNRRASLVVLVVKNLPAVQRTEVQSLGPEHPLEKGMASHSSILPWIIPMDRRAWRATVHGLTKSQTGLSNYEQQATRIYCMTQEI